MRNWFHIEGSTGLDELRAQAHAVANCNPISRQESVVIHKHKFGLSCSFNKNPQEDTEHEVFLAESESRPNNDV